MNLRNLSPLVATTLFLLLPLASQALTGEEVFNSKCVNCHGANNTNTFIPTLFGQEPGYIKSSIAKFKSGERLDGVVLGSMNHVARGLKDEEINSVATYLVARDICDVQQDIDPEKDGFIESFKAGREIVTKANCMHCHGSFHHGAPRLFGQNREYVGYSLESFRSGERKDPMMNRLTEKMTDEQIEQISTYLNGMRLMRECPSN